MTEKKTKRKLNGKPLALFFTVILIAICLYKVPHFINITKLEKLGYSQEAISAIYSKGLRKEILKNEYYSDYLNQEIVKDTFRPEYIDLYVVCNELNDDYFYLFERLIQLKGYTRDELKLLFSSLKYDSLVPLVVFDKLNDIQLYIDDCLAHPTNNKTTFVLDNDYLNGYENPIEIKDKTAVDCFVSRKTDLGTYKPDKLVQVVEQNGIDGVQLESRALEAFDNMCKALRENGTAIYAISGFRSYEDQKEQYISVGDETEKAGYNERQLGLSVSVVSSENEDANSFTDTKAYRWLKENAHNYGFILRYPEGKESITGREALSNYYRFVGVDLAKKIYESGLTFDEYYFLYLY